MQATPGKNIPFPNSVRRLEDCMRATSMRLERVFPHNKSPQPIPGPQQQRARIPPRHGDRNHASQKSVTQ